MQVWKDAQLVSNKPLRDNEQVELGEIGSPDASALHAASAGMELVGDNPSAITTPISPPIERTRARARADIRADAALCFAVRSQAPR
jgi:hypothetical protein